MGQRGRGSAETIEEEKAPPAKHVLDVAAEQPEVDCVCRYVQPAGVQEEAGEEGCPGEVGWNHAESPQQRMEFEVIQPQSIEKTADGQGN